MDTQKHKDGLDYSEHCKKMTAIYERFEIKFSLEKKCHKQQLCDVLEQLLKSINELVEILKDNNK